MKYFFLALLVFTSTNTLSAMNRPYQEVLKSLYPNCEITKKIHYLTDAQVSQIEKKIKTKLYSKIRIQFKDSCNQDTIYLDSHLVRTLNETVLVALNSSKVTHIKIASFMEPKEYLPPQKWIDQLKTKELSKVDSLSGATLSENALKRSLSEIKVIHEVIEKQAL